MREQAAEVRAAAAESHRVALESAAAEAAASAAAEVQSLHCELKLVQQNYAELQQQLQRSDASSAESLRVAAAEVASLSAAMLDLQRSHRCNVLGIWRFMVT